MTIIMDKIVELTGQSPTCSIKDVKIRIECLYNNDIVILVTGKDVSALSGTHKHDSYEFCIVHNEIPSTVIDGQVYDRTVNSLFAVNPMQKHGLLKDLNSFSMCGLHVTKQLMQSVSKSIYGSSNIVFSNESFAVSHDLRMLTDLFLEELRYKQSGFEFMTENLGLLIIGNLTRLIKHNLPKKINNVTRKSKDNIKIILDYMNENYATGVSCEELSKIIKIDKYSFIRNFKAQTGKTPYEYLLDLKIEKAKKMLKAADYTVTEISMACGFSSHSHFRSTFKKRTGIPPTQYRMEH